MRRPVLLSIGVLALLAGGCVSLEPHLQTPAPPVAAAWPIPPTTDATAETAAADVGWRDFFADPKLQQLLALALENNRDLRTAALDVAAVQALYRVQRAERFPSVDASGGAVRQRLPAALNGGSSATFTTYDVSVGVTAFELDLFGRVRSLEHAALERYFAQEEARRATQLALLGEVARTYLQLAADRQLQKLAADTLQSREESARLTGRQHEAGAVSGLEVAQAQTTVESARVDVERFAGEAAQDLDALTFLVGAPIDPALLPEGFATAATGAAPLPAGMPAEVLLRRPDVQQAEHTLRSANADIGAARAAFFPRIALTGSGGYAAAELSDLFTGAARAWSFAPSISVPIFQGGRLRANRRYAEVQRDRAVAQYERAIQAAFREVADALALTATLGRQATAQQALVDAAAREYEIVQQRKELGRDSYLATLEAQRTWYGAQQGLIQLRLAQEANRVTLYEALGGGWKERTGEEAR